MLGTGVGTGIRATRTGGRTARIAGRWATGCTGATGRTARVAARWRRFGQAKATLHRVRFAHHLWHLLADRFHLGHVFANRLADWLVDGLADVLHHGSANVFHDGFRNFAADRLRAVLHDRLGDGLAHGHGAFLNVRLADRLRHEEALLLDVRFANGLRDGERALLVLRFANLLVDGVAAFFHDRFRNGLADRLGHDLVAGLVHRLVIDASHFLHHRAAHGLVDGLVHGLADRFGDRLHAGLLFVAIAGLGDRLHDRFVDRLVAGGEPLFRDVIVNHLVRRLATVVTRREARLSCGNGAARRRIRRTTAVARLNIRCRPQGRNRRSQGYPPSHPHDVASSPNDRSHETLRSHGRTVPNRFLRRSIYSSRTFAMTSETANSGDSPESARLPKVSDATNATNERSGRRRTYSLHSAIRVHGV